MNSTIELTHRLNRNSAFVQQLIARGAEDLRDELESLTDEIVAEVEGIIRDELPSREGRRSKDDGHLLGSIEAAVTSPPGHFPVVIKVWSNLGDEEKVGALEFGARPHFIFATNAQYLTFPSNRVKRRGRGSILGLPSQVGGPSPFAKGGSGSRGGKGVALARVPHVHHPGNRPFHFMRRGLESVVRRRLESAR